MTAGHHADIVQTSFRYKSKTTQILSKYNLECKNHQKTIARLSKWRREYIQTSFKNHADIVEISCRQIKSEINSHPNIIQSSFTWYLDNTKMQTASTWQQDIMQTDFRYDSDIIQTSSRHHLDNKNDDISIKITAIQHSDIVQTSFRHRWDIIQTAKKWQQKQNDAQIYTNITQWCFKHHFRHYPNIIPISFIHHWNVI